MDADDLDFRVESLQAYSSSPQNLPSSPVRSESLQPSASITAKPQGEPSGFVPLNYFQRQLLLAYNAYGIYGLRSVIQPHIIRKHFQNPKIKSWAKFKDWMEDKDMPWFEYYIRSMEPRFVRALIEGRVAKMAKCNEEFARCAEENHKLKNTPQVYLNVCCRGEFSRISSTQDLRRSKQQMNPDEEEGYFRGKGYGPSIRLIREVLDDMELYLLIKHPKSEALAQEVDEGFPQKNHEAILKSRRHGRMYIPTDRALDFLKDWVKRLKRDFEKLEYKWETNRIWSDLEWAFSEVGFGVQAISRAPMHSYHDGTNYLFGLFTACLKHRCPGEFEIVSFAVMDVLYPEHADVCEILGSLLAGSYGKEDGWGLNPVYAGGAAMQGDNAITSNQFARLFEENRNISCKKTTFEKAEDYDRQTREETRKLIDFDKPSMLAKFKEAENELEEIETEYNMEKRRYDERAELKRLSKLKLRSMGHEVPEIGEEGRD